MTRASLYAAIMDLRDACEVAKRRLADGDDVESIMRTVMELPMRSVNEVFEESSHGRLQVPGRRTVNEGRVCSKCLDGRRKLPRSQRTTSPVAAPKATIREPVVYSIGSAE